MKDKNIRILIRETVDQYKIDHKGGVQCKCISGARGHLIEKLIDLFENKLQIIKEKQ